MNGSESLLFAQPKAFDVFSSKHNFAPRPSPHGLNWKIEKWLRHRGSLSHMVCDRPNECPTVVHPGNPTGEDIIVVPVSLQNEASDGFQISPVAPHERSRNVAREQPGTFQAMFFEPLNDD